MRHVQNCWGHRRGGGRGIWGERSDGGCKYILKISDSDGEGIAYLSAMSGQPNWIICGRKTSNVVRNNQGGLIFDWKCPEYSLGWSCYQGTLSPLPTDGPICLTWERVCRPIYSTYRRSLLLRNARTLCIWPAGPVFFTSDSTPPSEH